MHEHLELCKQSIFKLTKVQGLFSAKRGRNGEALVATQNELFKRFNSLYSHNMLLLVLVPFKSLLGALCCWRACLSPRFRSRDPDNSFINYPTRMIYIYESIFPTCSSDPAIPKLTQIILFAVTIFWFSFNHTVFYNFQRQTPGVLCDVHYQFFKHD